MPYLGEVMKKTKALRLWHLRHNLRRILRGKRWIRVKDIKLASVHPHDARGVPFMMSKEDVDKELASRKESEIDDAWSHHKMLMYGGDDE